MGLDLMIFRTSELRDSYKTNKRADELCYGRKTWVIEHFFENGAIGLFEDRDEMYILGRDIWVKFKRLCEEADIEKMRACLDSIYDLEYSDNAPDPELIDTDTENFIQRLKGIVLESMAHIFGSDEWDYHIGYYNESRVTLDWYDKVDEILKIYDEGDSVTMWSSY